MRILAYLLVLGPRGRGGGEGGGEGTQQMFICFGYLILTNGISFTDLISNFPSLLTAVTALTFK